MGSLGPIGNHSPNISQTGSSEELTAGFSKKIDTGGFPNGITVTIETKAPELTSLNPIFSELTEMVEQFEQPEMLDHTERREMATEVALTNIKSRTSPSVDISKKTPIEKRFKEISVKADEALNKATMKIENSDKSEEAKKSALTRLKTKKVAGLILIALGAVITAVSIVATFGPLGPAGAVGVVLGLSLIYGGMFLTTYGMAEEADIEASTARIDAYENDFTGKNFPDFLQAHDNNWDESLKKDLAKEVKSFIKEHKSDYDNDYKLKNDASKKRTEEIEKDWKELQGKIKRPNKLFPPKAEDSQNKQSLSEINQYNDTYGHDH